MQKKQDIFELIWSKLLLRLIIGGGIIVVGILISDIPMMLVSQGWPSTDGKILYHKFMGQKFEEYDGDFYTNIEVYIRYEYFVEGITYTSLSINSIDTPLNLYPLDYASRYPVGKEVTVYYNPKSPSEAILEPGFVDVFKAFDVFSLTILGLGIYFIYSGFKQAKARKTSKSDLSF